MTVLAAPPSRGAKRKQKPPNPFLPRRADELHRLIQGLETQRELQQPPFTRGGMRHDFDVLLDEFPRSPSNQPFSTASRAEVFVCRAFQRTKRCWNPVSIQMLPCLPSTVILGHIHEMPRWCG